MHPRIRPLLLAALAALLLGLAACGGDDSTAERKTRDGASPALSPEAVAGAANETATPRLSGSAAARANPSGRTLDVNCDTDITALRFEGTLSVKGSSTGTGGSSDDDPGDLFGSLLGDVRFSGAYQAPDRMQLRAELGGDESFLGGPVEFVQIGDTAYMRLGSTPWQESTAGDGLADQFDPRSFCRDLVRELPGDAPGRGERVNGVDATRYEYDRAALEAASDSFDDLTGGERLPENTKLTVWVSDKERFPVRLVLTGSGARPDESASINMEFNVTDLNSPDVRIEAPR